jgi:hypothetical protein
MRASIRFWHRSVMADSFFWERCRCTLCWRAHTDVERARGRARAQQRLPPEVRQQLLDAIYAGRPFRAVLSDLELTPNRLVKADDEWSAAH